MEKLYLKEIASLLGCSVDRDALITSVSTDTRKIGKNSLFIAIEGERFDAHDFVEQAARSGAVAVVIHKDVECSVPTLRVKDTVEAYLDIAGYYRDKFNIPVVGLTGSVGKTTTKEMTALAVSAGFKTLKTEANYNNHIGMPSTLLNLDKSYEAAVIEMGMNHFGEIHALTTRSKPTVGIITNIGVSHIENLGSREGILKAKLEILDGMASGAPLILNGDDDLLRTVELNDRPVYFFGIESDCDFKAENISEDLSNTHFLVKYSGSETVINLPCVGKHNVLDALAAFAAAYVLNIDPEKIADALSHYIPSGMRQKIVPCGDFTVIEDCYNASPDSMRASISTLAGVKGGAKIAVLGDMLELGSFSEKMHSSVGEFCAKQKIDKLMCCGDNAKFYVRSALENGISSAVHFENKQELANAVFEQAKNGAVLLFKASHGMHFEQIISDLYERNGIK